MAKQDNISDSTSGIGQLEKRFDDLREDVKSSNDSLKQDMRDVVTSLTEVSKSLTFMAAEQKAMRERQTHRDKVIEDVLSDVEVRITENEKTQNEFKRKINDKLEKQELELDNIKNIVSVLDKERADKLDWSKWKKRAAITAILTIIASSISYIVTTLI